MGNHPARTHSLRVVLVGLDNNTDNDAASNESLNFGNKTQIVVINILNLSILIWLSPLFVFYSSLNYDGPRTKAFMIQFWECK